MDKKVDSSSRASVGRSELNFEMGISNHPDYLALRGRINEGLRKAGMPDE